MYSIAYLPIGFKCCKVAEEFVSTASKELSSLVPPGVDFHSNSDLFGVTFDAAVVGVFNKNDDGVRADDALAKLSTFIHKPCNYGHNTDVVVGHILNYGCSEYKGERILSEEEARNLGVFDISLFAVVYKRCNEAWRVINSTHANFPEFKGISASWEVGFNVFDIAICADDTTTIAEAEIVTAEDDRFTDLSFRLRAFGGSGILPDGRKVKRVLKNITFLGIGFTERPAADVDPVESVEKAVPIPLEPPLEDPDEFPAVAQVIENPVADSSDTTLFQEENKQNKENSVIQQRKLDINMTQEDFTKLLQEKTACDEAVASSLYDACKEALREGNQEYLNQIADKEKALAEAENAKSEYVAKIEELESRIAAFVAEKAEVQAQELFNSRMGAIDEKYALSPEERELIAKKLNSLASEEDYSSLLDELAILWKSRTVVPAVEEPVVEDKAILDEAKASVEEQVLPNKATEELSSMEKFKALASKVEIQLS
jgi:hypothetical protein